MKKHVLNLCRMALLFIVCGAFYYFIEVLYRGYSHWSMFILAGICGVFFIDTPNNIYTFDLDYAIQIAISTVLCTIAEGLTGIYVNIIHDWHVWDYSNLPFTFFCGQCNLFFVAAWALLIGCVGIFLCDAFNYYICHMDPVPYYKHKGKIFLKFPERRYHD